MQRRRLRPARRLRLRLRSPRWRGQGVSPRRCRRSLGQPRRSLPGAHEPRPRDGRRPAQEDRHRQPVHGLRRARHRHPQRSADGRRCRSGRDPAASTSTTPRPARSALGSTDDIACWFIDTDYDGESFFVRHAYFTGADEPYEKLKRALRAEIDEDAWATLYSHREPPLPAPVDRQDRRQGHQPLRRRGPEGLRGRVGLIPSET